MAKFKVAVCAGHGGSGSTPGKRTPAGEYEWNFNDVVVRAGIAKLKANGVEVLRTDDASGKTDIGLTARTNKANSWGADVYWSAHHNALGGKWFNYGGGIETFTQSGSHPQSEKLAKLVHPKYVKAMGLRDRGLKKANFAITRQTKMPAILTEGGFMDSSIDIKAMRDNKKLIAQGEAIAEGILEYLGVKNIKDSDKDIKPVNPPKESTPKPEWTLVTGSWNGSPLLKNGHYGKPVRQVQTILKNHGYLTSSQVDDYFGDTTETALRKAQKDFGIAVDGLAGKDSYRVLSKSPSKGSSSKGKYAGGDSKTTSVVTYLNSLKINSSFNNRKKIAKEFGISNYSGTAAQNTKLLDLMRKSGTKSSSKPKAKLNVDGDWGPATTRALQEALNTTVDGVISRQPNNAVTRAISGVTYGSGGSPMVRALQKKVKSTSDGDLGPNTVSNLQKYLGTPQDGVISQPSSTMVKELQRRLNAGTF